MIVDAEDMYEVVHLAYQLVGFAGLEKVEYVKRLRGGGSRKESSAGSSLDAGS